MRTVTGAVNDKYTVIDKDDCIEDLVTIEDLYLYRAIGIYVEGCHFTKDGLVIDIDGRLCPRGIVDVPEVWRPVLDIQDDRSLCGYKYEVSNLGRVRRAEYLTARGVVHQSVILHPSNVHNYYACSFAVDGRMRLFTVHRMVAKAFIPNVRGVDTVNHLDENGLNNRVDNLEWCTFIENCNYGTRNARVAAKNSIEVWQYDLSLNLIKKWKSASDVERKLHIPRMSIYKCCGSSCSNVTAGGFIWRYAKDVDGDIEPVNLDGHYIRMGFDVRQYTRDGVFVKEFASARSASLITGCRVTGILMCCRGEQRMCGGYIWRFINSDEFSNRPENRVLIEEFHRLKKEGVPYE